ncbi:unnamed protein product [Discula destructiva]
MNEDLIYAVSAGMTGVYNFETGWTAPSANFDGALRRSQSISSGLTFMGVDNGSATADLDACISGDIYGPTMPWTPPNDISATFVDSPTVTKLPSAHGRSQSYDTNNHSMGWADPTSPEIFSFNQLSTPSNIASSYFPSPTATPTMTALIARPASSPSTSTGGSCICFTVCLQSLQALHNASSPSPPPFDLVLSLNRKAVEGCAAMLGCTRCMRRSGTHTTAMLLATLLGTITTFYKNASQSYFDHGVPMGNNSAETILSSPTSTPSLTGSPGLGVSLGVYTINGEDSKWLELEILGRELRRLDEVYSNFREVCSELSEDTELSKAMIGYLGQNLGSTMQVVSHRKGDMGYL